MQTAAEFRANPAAFTIDRLTLAMEFTASALRAVAEGHKPTDDAVTSMVRFAYASIQECVVLTAPEPVVRLARRRRTGEKGSSKRANTRAAQDID
jgi:hypothetical protein